MAPANPELTELDAPNPGEVTEKIPSASGILSLKNLN